MKHKLWKKRIAVFLVIAMMLSFMPQTWAGTEDAAAGTVSSATGEVSSPSALQWSDGEQAAECVCTEPCTEETINLDCPVCGAEGAELNQCAASVSLKAVQNEIEVEGKKDWAEIETAINEIIEADPDAQVKIVGKDSGAVISLKGLTTDVNGLYNTKAIELQSDTIFENVTLQVVCKEAKDPNIAIFANGHNLYVADTVKTERVGGYTNTKNIYIFGGGNNKAIENTHIEINGGDWNRIYGGSCKASSGDTYVHVAGDAGVLSVYGGCYGEVTTGNIYVEYGANRSFSDSPSSNYRLAYVIGSGHDISGEAQIANVTGKKIEIKILSEALLSSVYGGLNSMIFSDDVYVTVEEGAKVLESVSGGATTSSAEKGSLASDYWPGKTQYMANSNIHVLFNGEGRLDDTKAYSASVTGGGIWGNVEGDIDITVNGNVEYVYGGSHNGDVAGDINITINGGVYAGGSNADLEFDGVSEWYGGTVTSGCIGGTVTGNITTTINKDAEVHSVIGGSDDGGVVGSTNVHVYGTILKKNYEDANRALSGAGCVYGGGYLGSSACIDSTDVSGKANVYIYEGSDVQGDVYGGGLTARCSGGTNVVVSGAVRGDVYGGSWLHESSNQYRQYELGYVGETYVELNGDGSANNVYGGGRIVNVHGVSTFLLKDNAKVNNVYGTGDAYTTFYFDGDEYTFGPIGIETTGNVKIQIQDMAAVTDTIYGYEVVEIADEKKKLLNGRAEVFFNHSNNNGVFKRVENADLVQVTDNSNVMIDNNHQDNEQLVNVFDLTIDDSATLKLGADAHILGNYQGDKSKSGTLIIPAGKCLTADGKVTDLTKISIYDYNEVIPVKAQIYVISGAGSTTDDGDFTWVDTRNGVYMDWKEHETIEGATQWWLVNDPEPKIRGKLTVSKEVAGDAGDKDKPFTFTVTLDDTSIGINYGDMTFKDGVATFTLKHGESKTALGLPAGVKYVVQESDNAGYTVEAIGAEGTIEKAKEAVVKFTNHKDKQTGNLTVSKTVSGSGASKDKLFTFTVTLDDKTLNGDYGDVTFKDGVAIFKLKHGESKKATGLPADITYSVVESDNSGYTVTATDDTGTIAADQTATAAFTNYKGSSGGGGGDSDTPQTGSLEIRKIVSGAGGDREKAFIFTVTLDDNSISGQYGDMTFHKGVATVMLKHGESTKATGLPKNVGYEVTESGNSGYTVTASGEKGVLAQGETAHVLFENHKDTTPGEEPDEPSTDNPNVPDESSSDNPPDADNSEDIEDNKPPTGSMDTDEPTTEVPLGEAPKTGDTAPILLLSGVLVAAACGIVLSRRKRNQ